MILKMRCRNGRNLRRNETGNLNVMSRHFFLLIPLCFDLLPSTFQAYDGMWKSSQGPVFLSLPF
jgi:hypothetical protein